jgi:hypothetical protein
MKIPLPNIRKFNPDDNPDFQDPPDKNSPDKSKSDQENPDDALKSPAPVLPVNLPNSIETSSISLKTSEPGSISPNSFQSGLYSMCLGEYPDMSKDRLLFQSFLISSESRFMSKQSSLTPSLITLQGVLSEHNDLTSCPGYESVFFLPGVETLGFTTMWKTSKFSLEKILKIEFSIMNSNNRFSGNGALVTLLSTNSHQKVCLVNTKMSLHKEKREIETFLLLFKLNTLIKNADFLIITGLRMEMEKILCQEGNFKSFSQENFKNVQNVVIVENGISVKFRYEKKSLNQFSRFFKMEVQSLEDFCVFYLGRLGGEKFGEVFRFIGS